MIPTTLVTAGGGVCRAGLSAFLELLLPEHCAACGTPAGFTPWEATGARVRGLRPWDRPHLCRECATALFGQGRARVLDGRSLAPDLPVWAATGTSSVLTAVVGAWKYHGVRGLGWPLGRALAAVATAEPFQFWGGSGGKNFINAAIGDGARLGCCIREALHQII